jgi:AcrR family transcriptional regulator
MLVVGPGADTKTQVMDAAEALFAEQGFDATSMRAITTAAGVNLASVNYHFRTKEGLLDAILARRLTPLNEQRKIMLQKVLEEAGEQPPPLEKLVEALVAPPLRHASDLSAGGGTFVRLIGRIHSEPRDDLRALFMKHFEEVQRLFMQAFHRALPQLSKTELLMRGIFSVAAMAQTMCNCRQLPHYQELLETVSVEESIRMLVSYICGGLRAEPVLK